MTPVAQDLAQRLRAIPVFSELPEDDLSWLSSRMSVRTFAPGEIIGREGDPVQQMIVILEGEIRGRHETTADDGRTYTAYAGQVTGMLPYSRLTRYPLTTRAALPTTLGVLSSEHFPEMLQRMPQLTGRLVSVLADRVRETARSEQEREKLAALGKLSAGLAHELNNPAAAARRAADDLREAVNALREANIRLDKRPLGTDARTFLAHVECGWKAEASQTLDALDRSDREDEIGHWLERHGMADAWKFSPALVESGCDLKTLDELAARFHDSALSDAIARMSASFTISRLT